MLTPFARRRDEGREEDREDWEGRDRGRSRSAPEKSNKGSSVVFWVLGGIALFGFLVIGICAGGVWYVARMAGRAVEHIATEVKDLQPTRPIIDRADALATLRSPNPGDRLAALQWLDAQPPDPDRIRHQATVDAIQPLLKDENMFLGGAARQTLDNLRNRH